MSQEGMTSCPASVRIVHRLSELGRFRSVVGVVGWCVALAMASRFAIPIFGTDVPMTLQLLVVVLAGLSLSPVCACSSMMLYLACGSAGLPVFSPLSLGVLGPTGGYLVGFVVGCWLTAMVASSGRRTFPRMLVAGLCCAAVVLALGAAWRIPFVGVSSALATCVVPFATKAVIEVVLAVATASTSDGVRRWLGPREA